MGPLLDKITRANMDTYALAISGATTERVSKNLNLLTSHLTPVDNLIFMTGANDIKKNTNATEVNLYIEERKNMISQSKHTNVTLVAAPHRYDDISLNEYVDAYNDQLIQHCKKMETEMRIQGRLYLLDPNKYIAQMHYTSGGFHLNIRGKEVLCNAIIDHVNKINQKSQVFN